MEEYRKKEGMGVQDHDGQDTVESFRLAGAFSVICTYVLACGSTSE